MAFAIDRVEAARRLSVSTRTVDRHIQAGRIRTKRIGKKMFLHEDDVELIRVSEPSHEEEELVFFDNESEKDDVEVIPKKREMIEREVNLPDFHELYREASAIISKKDEIIQDLSYRLGKNENELKNSIPLIEYNRATFLLESTKTKGSEDTQSLSKEVENLEKEITKRNSAILGLAILFVLVLAFSVVFFLSTKLALFG